MHLVAFAKNKHIFLYTVVTYFSFMFLCFMCNESKMKIIQVAMNSTKCIIKINLTKFFAKNLCDWNVKKCKNLDLLCQCVQRFKFWIRLCEKAGRRFGWRTSWTSFITFTWLGYCGRSTKHENPANQKVNYEKDIYNFNIPTYLKYNFFQHTHLLTEVLPIHIILHSFNASHNSNNLSFGINLVNISAIINSDGIYSKCTLDCLYILINSFNSFLIFKKYLMGAR